jgi:hypothetical protein
MSLGIRNYVIRGMAVTENQLQDVSNNRIPDGKEPHPNDLKSVFSADELSGGEERNYKI